MVSSGSPAPDTELNIGLADELRLESLLLFLSCDQLWPDQADPRIRSA